MIFTISLSQPVGDIILHPLKSILLAMDNLAIYAIDIRESK